MTLVTRPQPQPVRASLAIPRVALTNTKTFHLPCEPANLTGPIDQLLVTTKSNQVLQALEEVSPRLSASTKIVLLHNGMGTLEPAQQLFTPEQIYCGVTTEGAYQQQPANNEATESSKQLVYAGQGSTEIGQIGQAVAPGWVQPLLDSSLGFSWQSSIEVVLWRKLLINCAINPLTAIHNCRNGELLRNPTLNAKLHLLVAELTQVANAIGHKQLANNLIEIVQQVLTLTQDNFASMQQDLHHHRATEIAYINGYLCEQAKLHGIATPLNEELVAAVQRLEQAYAATESP